jgi:hypothetical protein
MPGVFRDRQGIGEGLTPMIAKRYALAFAAVAVAIALGGTIIGASGGRADPSQLLGSLGWIALIVVAIILFEEPARDALLSLARKIDSAERIEFRGVVIQGTQRIPIPDNKHAVTLDNIALMHTSFLRPDKTREFNDGMPYFQIEVIVLAPAPVLDRIERVTYYLDPSYPNPTREVADRKSRFKLKELANGTSIVRASIKLRNQDEPLQLNRFIDLRPEGPKL